MEENTGYLEEIGADMPELSQEQPCTEPSSPHADLQETPLGAEGISSRKEAEIQPSKVPAAVVRPKQWSLTSQPHAHASDEEDSLQYTGSNDDETVPLLRRGSQEIISPIMDPVFKAGGIEVVLHQTPPLKDDEESKSSMTEDATEPSVAQQTLPDKPEDLPDTEDQHTEGSAHEEDGTDAGLVSEHRELSTEKEDEEETSIKQISGSAEDTNDIPPDIEEIARAAALVRVLSDELSFPVQESTHDDSDGLEALGAVGGRSESPFSPLSLTHDEDSYTESSGEEAYHRKVRVPIMKSVAKSLFPGLAHHLSNPAGPGPDWVRLARAAGMTGQEIDHIVDTTPQINAQPESSVPVEKDTPDNVMTPNVPTNNRFHLLTETESSSHDLPANGNDSNESQNNSQTQRGSGSNQAHDESQTRAEIIIIGDSNTTGIIPSMLYPDKRVQKLSAMTIPQATQLINSTIYTDPKCIVYHVGTNDIKQERAANGVTENLRKLVMTTHDLYPNAAIVMSSVPPRNDQHLMDVTRDVNSFLHILDQETSYISVANNNNFEVGGSIKLSLYRHDGYHLNKGGLRVLAANWKQAIHPTVGLGSYSRGKRNPTSPQSKTKQDNRTPGNPTARQLAPSQQSTINQLQAPGTARQGQTSRQERYMPANRGPRFGGQNFAPGQNTPREHQGSGRDDKLPQHLSEGTAKTWGPFNMQPPGWQREPAPFIPRPFHPLHRPPPPFNGYDDMNPNCFPEMLNGPPPWFHPQRFQGYPSALWPPYYDNVRY